MCRTPAGPGAGAHAFGVYLQDAGIGDGAAGCRLSVDASWLDATGADDGVACMGGSLVSARIVAPAGGAFGAGGVLDIAGAVATHVVIEPEGATAPAGETSGGVAPGCGAGQPAGGAGPATEQPGTGPTTDPAVKPTAATPKTTTTSKTTVTKTTVSASSKPKVTTAVSATLPKTGNSSWLPPPWRFSYWEQRSWPPHIATEVLVFQKSTVPEHSSLAARRSSRIDHSKYWTRR